VVEKGKFVVIQYTLQLVSVGLDSCKLKVSIQDTLGNEESRTQTFELQSDLARDLRDDRLRGFKIIEIVDDSQDSYVLFGNNQKLYTNSPILFQSEQGQKPSERAQLAPTTTFPVFNLIDRAARETGLTRPTLNEIFRQISDRKKKTIFTNPEGFASLFISEINNALADHIAEHIQFEVTPAPLKWGHDLDDLFPPEKEFPQRELVPASPAGLYDQIQTDSDVEQRFVIERLNEDDQVLFYFKFPPAFKIEFPRVIGNYNPDWGIARYRDGKFLIELVRETKGSEDLAGLQFPSEARKIRCAQKHFHTVGIDYRVISDPFLNWWTSSDDLPTQTEFPKL
jgi:type III restriction enzyme